MLESDPEVPVTVMVYNPVGVEVVVPTDNVEVAVPLTAGVTEGADRLQRIVGLSLIHI